MGKKHKPPSRERYEKNNPNWTVRLTRYLFEALQAFLVKSGLSRRDFIAIALGEQEMEYERVRTEGYNDGFVDGEESGYEDGSSEGYDKGWQDGFTAGQEKGKAEGYQKGYSEGLERGKKEGFDEGAEYLSGLMRDRYNL